MNAPTKSMLPEVEELRAAVAGPFESARAAPRSVYVSEAFAAREVETIFERDWICVGRAEQLAEAGDYIAYELAGRPIFVIRDHAGAIRGFSNVCLHRMSTLLEGTGRARRITCPYHGWTYDTEGRLVAAAAMKENCAFVAGDYRLPEIRVEIWLGWIFVTLDRDASPFADRLASLEAIIADYQVEAYVQSFRESFVWDTNWKVLAENFMESYHLHVCHAGTIGANSRLDEMDCPPGEPAYNIHSLLKSWDAPLQIAHPNNTRLDGDRRRETHIIAIYPGFMLTLTPGYFWYLSLHPRGAGRVHVTFAGGLSPDYSGEPGAAAHFAEAKSFIDRINAEDKVCTERVYRGLQSDLARPGHLSHLERPLYDFGRWLLARTSG